MTAEEQLFAYDKVIYPNYLHPQTHPDWLAMMAKFFGVNPKPVENCRVLELGCGTGSSLLSFALDLPGSEFIGVDLSEKQIEIARAAVEAVGLKNLSFRHGDIMEIDRAGYGEFDYIIAHGLYSWVPEFVRDQILNICRELLAERGVAYISYNALPGCYFRKMAREIMLFYTRDMVEPVEKVRQSLGMLKFIADAALPNKLHKQVLLAEFDKLKDRRIENILHDDLSDVNHPVYFHEFVEHAQKYDLQFVTEVEHFPNKSGIYAPEVMETLRGISEDVIALEQYLDFIDGRLFRSSVLCRGEINLRPHPDPKVLREVLISSPLKPVSETPELSTTKHEVFSAGKDETVEMDHPLTKAAFFHLGRIWKDSTTLAELIEASRRLLSEESGVEVEITETDEENLTQMLFQIFSPVFLHFHIHEPAFATEVSEKPLASPLARWQSQTSDTISTLRCTEFVIADPLGKELLRLLDGTRDHEALAEGLTEFIMSEKFDHPSWVKGNILNDLPEQLEKSLAVFAEKALLVS